MGEQAAKYVLLGREARPVLGSTAFRVQALRDIPRHGVRAGDLGGWASSETNLSQRGDAWIADEAMAVQGARIEDDAVMIDCATLADEAILGGSARMEGFARLSGHAVMRGESRAKELTSVAGNALIDGDAELGQATAIRDTFRLRDRSEAPWALSHASWDEPWHHERLREALEIDPALHRALAVLGATTAVERRSMMQELRTGGIAAPSGLPASLRAIVRALGGTFTPQDYHPRDAAQITAERAVHAWETARRWDMRGFCALCAMDPDMAEDARTGEPITAGAVIMVPRLTDGVPNARLFQPAILRGRALDDRLPLQPAPFAVTVIPEPYPTLLDALVRSRSIRDARAGAGAAEELAVSSPRTTGAAAFRSAVLPVLVHVRGGAAGAELDLERTSTDRPGWSRVMAREGLVIGLDLAEVTAGPDFAWRRTRLEAAAQPYSVVVTLPPPSAALAALLTRVAARSGPDPAPDQEGDGQVKRDMDLVRELLVLIENNENINGRLVVSDGVFSSVSDDRSKVQYHLRLLLDAKLIDGRDLVKDMREGTPLGRGSFMVMAGNAIEVERLTWEGHDFLDSVRDPKVWSKTKGYLSKVGSVGFDVLKDVAKAVAKDQIKQYTGLSL